jgi:PAS domain S-box-containing protein
LTFGSIGDPYLHRAKTLAFHPEERPRIEEGWRATVATGAPFEKEARIRRADGEYRWFLIRAVPLRDELGRIVKWYGTITDIEDARRRNR